MSRQPVNRRTFLTVVGRTAGSACVACAVSEAMTDRALGSPEPGLLREVDFYEQLPGKRIKCFVCPLHCELTEGQTCFCRTRTNQNGKLYTRAYNNPCVLSVDPIEKLPLNHYRPGTQTLTIGVGGCNLRCLYCQNWEQSQERPERQRTYNLSADDAVAAARKKKLDTIALSYTEPVAFLEYAKDIAIAARKARLKVVVASAGFIDPEPLLDFAQHVDAFSITLKGFDEEYYHRVLGVSLAPVLTAIETIKTRTRCWLELVNLVVPTYNDDPGRIADMARWVRATLGQDVPLHFSRFVPDYRLKDLPRTAVQTLEAARTAGHDAGLRYVYTSNIAPHDGCNTYCARCNASVVQRLGFKVLDSRVKKGICPKCRNRLPGVWT